MPRNVEFKARPRDWEGQLRLASEIAPVHQVVEQEDVFYAVARGRLKLRTVRDAGGTRLAAALILYDRPDRPGPKTSDYHVVAVPDPEALGAVLAAACGAERVVRKRRTRLLLGPASVHFDEVEGLGRFIEVEVAVDAATSTEHAAALAEEWRRRLGVRTEDLIPGAYADLLSGPTAPRP